MYAIDLYTTKIHRDSFVVSICRCSDFQRITTTEIASAAVLNHFSAIHDVPPIVVVDILIRVLLFLLA